MKRLSVNKKFQSFFFSVILSFGATFSLQAKTVTFPVNGLLVATKEPVPIETEWDEKWFFETPTTQYHHGIARIAAMFSEISYINAEKDSSNNELLRSYRLLGFKDKDISWNYVLDYTSPIEGNNQAAYSFASKDVQTPSGTKKLVFIVLRGTPLSANEWISNINVSDTTHKNVLIHEGFFRTVETIQKEFLYYLVRNKISPEEAVFMITGHSRGGALANLLGARLDDEGTITGNRLFVYTFASPNVSQEEKTSSEKYNFIWNIVNAEDIIPSVPPDRNEWKWKKFGQTKVIANYWNTEPQKYLDDYIPRMNSYFKRMLLRDYHPFKNGPFIQTQVARILTTLYKNVDNYYNSFFSLHSMAESIFWRIFPDYDKNEVPENPNDETHKKLPFFIRMVQKNVNSNIEGGFEYAMTAFVDMHGCETYLSWLLALNEEEAYSTLGSTQISFDGSHDCAVYDDEGKLLARIQDGAIELFSLKIPVAGMPYPSKNVLGFPGNQNLTVVIHKDSLIPTIITYRIECYDAAGKLTSVSEPKNLYPRTKHAIRFTAGKETLETGAIAYERLSKPETKQIRKEYGLQQHLTFRIQPEISFSTEHILNLGGRIGCQEIYGSILADIYTPDTASAAGFTVGIGHQHSLYGRFLLDCEVLNHFVWADVFGEHNNFSYVPAGRVSISFKPRHRFQFFMSTMFDAHFDGFNDSAFTSEIRKKSLSSIKFGDSLELVPSLQFGLRF